MNGIIQELNNASTISDALIERCADRCIETTNAKEGILKLKELAADCKTKADYIAFFKNTLKLKC